MYNKMRFGWIFTVLIFYVHFAIFSTLERSTQKKIKKNFRITPPRNAQEWAKTPQPFVYQILTGAKGWFCVPEIFRNSLKMSTLRARRLVLVFLPICQSVCHFVSKNCHFVSVLFLAHFSLYKGQKTQTN